MTTSLMINKHTYQYYFFSLIVLILMFGFGYLPAYPPLTQLGMQILGIFLGLILGWMTVGMIWPTVLGMIALGLTDYATVPEVFRQGFGHDITLFLFFTFIFTAVVEDAKITQVISSWLISRRIAQNRPWVLSMLILIAAYSLGALASCFSAGIICWGILYNMCSHFGYDKTSDYPKFMLTAVVYTSLIGYSLLPFRLLPLIFFGAYRQISGENIPFLAYLLLAASIHIFCLLGVFLLGKYVFKIDVSAISKHQMLPISNLKPLNNYQKQVMFFLFGLIVLLFLPSLLPQNLTITATLQAIGPTGLTALTIAMMVFIKKNDKPLLNFKTMAVQGLNWDIIFLIAGVMLISDALTAEATGITAFLLLVLSSIITASNPLLFTVAVVILATLISNFSNNMVTGAIFVPLIYTFSQQINFNPVWLIVLLPTLLASSLLTPSACPMATMLHGNKEWLSAKDITIYGSAFALLSVIFSLLIGLPIATLLF